MRGRGFAVGLGVGVLAGFIVIIASVTVGGGGFLAPAARQANSAAGSAQSASTATVTSTVTYSSTTVPGPDQNGGNVTQALVPASSAANSYGQGFFMWHNTGPSVSSSLSSLASQPASVNLLILLPLALAVLAGVAFYRFAGKKEATD